MSTKDRLKNLIASRVVILDGAMGTQLHKRGMPQGTCPELWGIRNQDVLEDIHREYRMAGSDILYTCTFGANRIKLKEYHVSGVRLLNEKLARITRKAAGKDGLVAGDIGPTGEFVAPFGPLLFEDAVEIYKEQVRGLLKGGVDLLVIETMIDVQEARAALIAVKETCDLFVMVTMTYEKNGLTLNGTDPVSALVTLQSLGADAVGCNCSTGPQDMLKCIGAMKPYATVPLVAKPNAGMPRLSGAVTTFDMGVSDFSSFGQKFVSSGANMLGGCCGSNPAYIQALREAVKGKKPFLPIRKTLSALSSPRKTIIIDRDQPLVMVGERINPSGKKDLQKELQKGKSSLICAMAKEQQEEGASVLDVNVSLGSVDESIALRKAAAALAACSALPLSIDSSDPDAIEGALRLYPGRALINSVSAQPEKLKKLFPLAVKYGAMCIVLPVTGKKVPKTFQERKRIITDMLRWAHAYGLTKDDFVIDGLALSVSSNPTAAREALKTISWCADELGCLTLLGISNISFGLPQRPSINAAFLAMAQAHGLTMAILNTACPEVRRMRLAADALSWRHSGVLKFLGSFSANLGSAKQEKPAKKLTLEERIVNAVLQGNNDDIVMLARQAIGSGISASRIVNGVIIPAIKKVGQLFDRKVYFLPQLLASAQATKSAFKYLQPFLKVRKGSSRKKAVIVLATVKGDIHDIGKNIVSLMLKNHGFSVIDLGKDVSAQRIVSAAGQSNADIVGLSALMTTTMVNMKEVIGLARQKGLRCKFMVGGAAVTGAFARSLKAAYGKDAVQAVRIAQKLR